MWGGGGRSLPLWGGYRESIFTLSSVHQEGTWDLTQPCAHAYDSRFGLVKGFELHVSQWLMQSHKSEEGTYELHSIFQV